MRVTNLKCVKCGKTYPAISLYNCESCGGILDVEYRLDGLSEAEKHLSESYALMPLTRAEMNGFEALTTALIPSASLGMEAGIPQLYFKCEYQNLSGSFKDRPENVAVAMAKKLGKKRVIVASSGNAASATAAAAARFGLDCIVLIPESTPMEKVRQTVCHGAHVFTVPGPYSECYQLAVAFSNRYDAYNVTTTFINPYALEGDKIVGYELYEQLKAFPAAVYVPIGAGPLLAGIYKGLGEYAQIKSLPLSTRMIGVQARGNSPIAKAFDAGRTTVECECHPQTIAGGIADGLVGYEGDGEYALSICNCSGGAVRAVDEVAIQRARLLLASREGLFAEPSSAIALAAVLEDAQKKRLPQGPVIIVLTGHGLKDMHSLPGDMHATPVCNVSDIANGLGCSDIKNTKGVSPCTRNSQL